MTHPLPQDFALIPPYGPYGDLVGPFYGCIRDGVAYVRLHMAEKHANRSQTNMHGGMLATMADTALIWAIREFKPEINPFLTTQLSVDFLGAITIGDWVEARVTFVKHGRRLHVAECYFYVNDKIVGKASGQFIPMN